MASRWRNNGNSERICFGGAPKSLQMVTTAMKLKDTYSLAEKLWQTLNIHWKNWGWSWSANTLAIWCEEWTHWKRPWCWESLKVGEGDNRGWDGWIASLIQWTWVWANSGRWWRTGKPGVLQSTGLQIVRHDWVTEQQQQFYSWLRSYCLQPHFTAVQSCEGPLACDHSTREVLYYYDHGPRFLLSLPLICKFSKGRDQDNPVPGS